METYKKPWPLATLYGVRKTINTQADYQRPLVWSTAQKRLLVDTILRGYDIPKLYWRKTGKDQFEVVDGQQRLNAIWSFMSNEFDLGKDIDSINGNDVKKITYSQLPNDLRILFDIYALDVVIMDTDEEEVREMFLRLQNGTSLKAPEKRHAMSGNMRDFVVEVADYPFFKSCKKENVRYMFEQIAAQMVLLELNGGACNIKNADLNKMYEEYKDFDKSSQKAKKVRRTLDFLYKCFPQKTPELEWYAVISLYMIVSTLLDRYVVSDKEDTIFKWFIQFENYRRTEERKGEEECDREILNYNDQTGHSTDSTDSLQRRYGYLFRLLLEYMPDMELKDNNRLFSHEQRLAIYRKDNGICQVKIKCNGIKCDWDNWQADHIKPWSKGGKTTVENGQVACPACNASKSDN
jgi:uncharacterized protein with ParB-like and HNH nuclease domain